MATKEFSILGLGTLPGAVVYFEPAAVNFQTNDRYPQLVAVFPNTATRDSLGFAFAVPSDFVDTAKLVVIWATTATTGDVVWDADYTAVGGDSTETADPSTDQESVSATDTAPGTACYEARVEIALTDANLAANDRVQGIVCRDGTNGSDTLAASAYLLDLRFQYADS